MEALGAQRGGLQPRLFARTAIHVFKYASFSLGKRNTSFCATVLNFTAQDYIFRVQYDRHTPSAAAAHGETTPCWGLSTTTAAPTSPKLLQESPVHAMQTTQLLWRPHSNGNSSL